MSAPTAFPRFCDMNLFWGAIYGKTLNSTEVGTLFAAGHRRLCTNTPAPTVVPVTEVVICSDCDNEEEFNPWFLLYLL